MSSERKTLISSCWQEIYSNSECLRTGYPACMKQTHHAAWCWYALPSTSSLLWYQSWVNNVWKPLECNTNWVKNFAQIHVCVYCTSKVNLEKLCYTMCFLIEWYVSCAPILLILSLQKQIRAGKENLFWARVQIVHKFQRNPFKCPWKFWRAK